MEKELKTLNDKLSSAVSECDTKDELVKKHAKMAQEAIKGNSLPTPIQFCPLLQNFVIWIFQTTLHSLQLMFLWKIVFYRLGKGRRTSSISEITTG